MNHPSVDFTLPRALEAHEPPEERPARKRDDVRLLVGRRGSGEMSHHAFRELPELLHPGDLLVVNTSATLPAAVHLDRITVHFSAPVPYGDDRLWLVGLRRRTGKASAPYSGGSPNEWIPMPGHATLALVRRHTDCLWVARLSTDVVPYLDRYGVPIRYGHVSQEWPTSAYQTVFASDSRERGTGSAEMPSAGRPSTHELGNPPHLTGRAHSATQPAHGYGFVRGT